ncbi:hypothetical protein LSTR_LSTR001774 [Laodelphax striatellus]|uniref:Uncharacterized protein n=1 Tax=Laodelphax striatellus TaxID=195883 RepID=A0A482WG41_LAOST|nr:hypothetical protein LSTR_LSTR001774 [Laodelphax striatellus]
MKHFLSFILVLIIISSCLQCKGESQLLHSIAGKVGGGNFTYYSLMYTGPISLYLISSTGDADLYISQTLSKPTYEPESYCLQSSTCGVDTVHIPKSFQRPVGIGIYGHPSHQVSIYLLEVYYRDNSPNDLIIEDGDELYDENVTFDKGRAALENKFGGEEKEEEIESFLGTLLWTFVNILLEVLFL